MREYLVCPLCRGDLVDMPDGLACHPCRLCYPVVDGVPWMLPARAHHWRDGQAKR